MVLGTEIPHPEAPEILEVPEKSVQNKIMDDFEVLDIDKVPIIYCDDDLGNSTTRTQSGYTFEEDEDKENVNCEPKNKKRKAGLLENSLSEIVNCSDPSSTTAVSCNNRSTKYGSSDKKKVKVDCSYNETEQVKKKNEKQPVALPEKIKSLNEISHLMLRVQEETLELNRQELQLRKDALKTQKGILEELKEMKKLLCP